MIRLLFGLACRTHSDSSTLGHSPKSILSLKRGRRSQRLARARAFASLVSVGTAIALVLSFVGSLNLETTGISIAFFIASFLGVYAVVLKVLGLKELAVPASS